MLKTYVQYVKFDFSPFSWCSEIDSYLNSYRNKHEVWTVLQAVKFRSFHDPAFWFH